MTNAITKSEFFEATGGRFTFEEEGHLYHLDGKPLTGVTTILQVLAKPALIQWAANCVDKHIKENAEKVMDGSKFFYQVTPELLEEARKAHAQKRDKAADTGTLAHKWLERWIKGEKPERDPALAHMTDNFLAWVEETDAYVMESEMRVYSEKHWYAGTLDFIVKIGGRTLLGDIKTSSGIYPEMFFQTAAYQQALKEMGSEYKIDGHVIVNITKDGKLNVAESTEYDENLAAFMGCLAIYRRQLQIKDSLKQT